MCVWERVRGEREMRMKREEREEKVREKKKESERRQREREKGKRRGGRDCVLFVPEVWISSSCGSLSISGCEPEVLFTSPLNSLPNPYSPLLMNIQGVSSLCHYQRVML